MTKLYVLTGFLGSGKTTVLSNILKELSGSRVCVIQNEFGKLGIDGEILRSDHITMREINKGSIFCSCLKLNFVQALAEMAEYDFDFLFVESSGLGDPSNIEEIVLSAKELGAGNYEFCGAICLVDALNFLDQVSDLETVDRQLKHCHLALITKAAQVDSNRIASLEGKIREINPVCPIRISQAGEIDTSFLQEDLMAYQWAEGEETTNSAENKPKTLVMHFEEPVPFEAFKDYAESLGESVFRMKGFMQTLEHGWMQVDVVCGKTDTRECEAKDEPSLTVISKIGPSVVKSLLEAWKDMVGTKMALKNS